MLLSMGFSQSGNIFEKQFASYGCWMKVDLSQCKLIYPEVIKGRERNDGFGATGTNTVVLFLEKYNEPPKRKDMISDSVSAILAGEELAEWEDKELFEAYSAQIGVAEEEYISFTKEEKGVFELCENEYFQMYADAFESSADTVKLKNFKAFSKLSAEQQTEELKRKFYSFAKNMEQEKLFYFSLAHKQNTLIISAPTDNAKQKEFLGYDWSNRKGAEGIQILSPGGKMYNDADRKAEGTLASAVRHSFLDVIPELSEENSMYAGVVKTADMLDYSRMSFNKALRTSAKRKFVIKSQYQLKKLSDVVEIISGGTPDTKIAGYWNGQIPWLSVADFNTGNRYVYTAEKHITEEGLKNSSTTYLQKNDLIISARGTVGVVAQLAEPMTFNQSCYGLRGNDVVLNDYLFYILSYEKEQILAVATGMKFPSIVRATFDEIQIPIPPITTQKEIVSECEKIDEEYNTTRMSIEEYRRKIEALFNELDIISSGGGTD